MTPEEWGARGYAVTVARYGEHRMNQWRAKGGRKRNPTLAEIEAVTGPKRVRVLLKVVKPMR